MKNLKYIDSLSGEENEKWDGYKRRSFRI
jgi:hypothetical protein